MGEGLAVLLESRVSQTYTSNVDLWMQVESYVLAMDPFALRVQHVNSHRAELFEDDPVDAWAARWNRIAGREAGKAHTLGPLAIQCVLDRFRSDFLEREMQLDLFHDFHLDLAEAAQSFSLAQDDDMDLADDDTQDDGLPFALSWKEVIGLTSPH